MATGILADAYQHVVDQITAAGLTPITDPRNVRPLTVFVELPTSTSGWNTNIVNLSITCRILAAGPGNLDAAEYLLQMGDTFHENVPGVTSITPSLALIGEQQIPALDFTVQVSTRRN